MNTRRFCGAGVVLTWFFTVAPLQAAEDWPTYRHDNARSGVTTTRLSPPLTLCWVFRPSWPPEQAWGEPNPRPVGGQTGAREGRRLQYDDVYHVTLASGSLYFGSSADGKVYALDARTARVRWTFLTGGPVRLAPTIWRDRVYVGSDDGYVYCLQAADGREVWRFQAAPADRQLLGSGKMISRWPVRTGVLVDRMGGEDVAYFGAGIFPSEGVYLFAVNARDGKLLWCYDTGGDSPSSVFSPQGYLLASRSSLFVPQGRVAPARFDRRTGQPVRMPNFPFPWEYSHAIGGTYAMLDGEQLLTGTEEIVGLNPQTGERFGWFSGRQLVLTPRLLVLANGQELRGLDREKYPQAALERRKRYEARQTVLERWSRVSNLVPQAESTLKASEQALAAIEQRIAGLAGQPVPPALEKEREAAVQKVAADRQALETARQHPLIKEREQAEKALAEAEAALEATVQWRCPTPCAESLILAGDLLIAGGTNQVVAVHADTGRPAWSAEVDAPARGLAVADGRLYVSTTNGTIYCFGPPDSPALGEVRPSTQPLPEDATAAVCHSAAGHILATTGVRRGYALVLGSGSGRLAYELARQSELTIYGVEPDAAKVTAARKALDAAGLYGKRVRIDQSDPNRLPYADFFANLVVSETALFEDRVPGNARETFRVLKPLGGVLMLGRPAGAGPLNATTLREWCGQGELQAARIVEQDGLWLTFTRGALPGAGKWTQLYAEPGNTTCSDDQRVTGPLAVLWFGEPGPGLMAERHARATAPLAGYGRLFMLGEGWARNSDGRHVVLCYDAYNGLPLWERILPGGLRCWISHDGSNWALSEDSLFLAAGKQCHRLDAATGRTVQTYEVPPAADGKPRQWGYVAAVGGRLYGSRGTQARVADCVFALDIPTGNLLWQYEAPGIQASAIAISDGKLFLAHTNVAPADRDAVLQELAAYVKTFSGVTRVAAEASLKTADARGVVALDAATGRELWRRPIAMPDATLPGPAAISLGAICSRGVLVLFGVYTDGHFWEAFYEGQFAARRITALDTADGRVLWATNIGYRVRPLVIGDTLHAEPWAYDLRTGQQRTRLHPVTGRPEPWLFPRPGHHCGAPAAGPNLLAFRSGVQGWYDLAADCGVEHFPTVRPGCWINFIPANGLLMVPEAGSGCLCPYPNSCTVVFAPSTEAQRWAWFGAHGALTPVKHLALNLGAPGDRRDRNGVLWLGYPRPEAHLVLGFQMETAMYPGGGWYRHDPLRLRVTGTDAPWLFASGLRGPQRLSIPLIGPGQGSAQYTVRLAFLEPDQAPPGRRVFDVHLMEQPVLTNFDIAREAGGPDRAVVREFRGVRVRDRLILDFIVRAREPQMTELPVLQAIEIEREQVLGPGIAFPEIELQDRDPTAHCDIDLENHAAEPFVGELRLEAPAGFAVEPAAMPLNLEAGHTLTTSVTVRLTRPGTTGVYRLTTRFVRADGEVVSEDTTQINYLGALSAEWHFLDLAPFANRPLWGEDAWIGMPLSQVKPGEGLYAGTPFRVLDQTKNNDMACIALRSKRVRTTRGVALPTTVEIPLGLKARAVYFLHGCGWVTNEDPLEFGRYEIVYADGSTAAIPLVAYGSKPEGGDLQTRRARSNIQDWWPGKYPPLSNDYVRPAVVYSDPRYPTTRRYLYVLEWTNPTPEKIIQALRLSADPDKDPSVLILGISVRAVP